MRHLNFKWGFSVFLLILFSFFLLSGCGSSQEKLELTNFLKTYEKLINDYTAAYDASDQLKKAELTKQIDSMTSRWVENVLKFVQRRTNFTPPPPTRHLYIIIHSKGSHKNKFAILSVEAPGRQSAKGFYLFA